MKDLRNLEERIGYTFEKKQLIIEALTHRSYKKPYNNERLEFLGDAVLDLVVGEFLFHKFENSDEGILSKIRASLVNENGFAKLARLIGLGDYIYLSPAEENNNGREKPSLLSNAFEALIGAIYLESGLDKSKEIAQALITQAHPVIDLETLSKDYKTALQEITQATHGITPTYVVLDSFGPDHKKEFEIAIILDDEQIAKAMGKSKKEAQQKAAKKALDILGKRSSHE
jgi:ribonuclease III